LGTSVEVETIEISSASSASGISSSFDLFLDLSSSIAFLLMGMTT
jgi:hypothetical protein